MNVRAFARELSEFPPVSFAKDFNQKLGAKESPVCARELWPRKNVVAVFLHRTWPWAGHTNLALLYSACLCCALPHFTVLCLVLVRVVFTLRWNSKVIHWHTSAKFSGSTFFWGLWTETERQTERNYKRDGTRETDREKL